MSEKLRLLGIVCICACLLILLIRVPGEPVLHASFALLLTLGFGLTCLVARGLGSRPGPETSPKHRFGSSVFILAGLLALYAVSSVISDAWFFPTDWRDAGEADLLSFKHGFIRCLVAALALTAGLRWLEASRWFVPAAWFFFAALALMHLYEATGFQMIYRVDSPSFVYRFWSFEQTFPRPGFYDPHWNAGVRVPFLVASGTWSIGVFLLPFIKLFGAEQVYTPSLAFFFLLIIPLLAWHSARWIGASRRACWIAALLALGSTQRFWVHLLHYGTAPALFALCMAMPLAALWYRFLYRDVRPRLATAILITFFAMIMFCWPGSLVTSLPFVLVTVLHFRRLFPEKWIWAAAGGAVLVIALLPLAMVPMRYSNIGGFVKTTAHLSLLEHAMNGLGVFSHNIRSTNMLIVIFGMAGVFLWPRKRIWTFFGPLILGLLFLSGWGEEFKKLLQSERLIIPASLIAALPAAMWMDRILRLAAKSGPSWRSIVLRASAGWILAVLLLGAYQGAKAWRGDGLAPFQTMPEHTRKLAEWLRDHVPPQGRVMFAGKAVHGYGGAKIAALPLMTGREMMACDYYGFSPKLTEYQYPPQAFRYEGPDVLFEFMELHNITHIVTWHNDWKNVFTRTDRYYRPVWKSGRVEVFETLRAPDMFLKGTGRVTATFDRFDLDIDPGQESVVIKYNWFPGLQATSGATVFPHDAGRGVTFIGIEPGTNRQVQVNYR